MDTHKILNKRISFCPNIHAKKYSTLTLFEALNSIRTGIYHKQIYNIRRLLSKGDIQSYKKKKKQLPEYVFAGIAYGCRHKFDISGYTSLIVVDIDNIENIDIAKLHLISDKHIVCVWKSPSGNGLKALFYIDYAVEIPKEYFWIFHEHCAFPQIERYLLTNYNVQIDKTGADITRLCFVSSDSEIHLKNDFVPFLVHVNLSRMEIDRIKSKYLFGRENIRKAINEEQRISKLIHNSSLNIADCSSSCPKCKETNNCRTKSMYSELQHLYSRICLLINSVDYDSAARLIAKIQEHITTSNSYTTENTCYNRISIFIDQCAEISAFLEFLKSIQHSSNEPNDIIEVTQHRLPLKFKTHGIRNMINKREFQSIINQLNHDNKLQDDSSRTLLIEQAKAIVSKGFRGAGCSILRKWARQQLSVIIALE